MNNSLYTQEELSGLKSMLDRINTHIPTELAHEVWNNYRKIKQSSEPQPCNCGSSAGLWRNAVDTIREYVKVNS